MQIMFLIDSLITVDYRGCQYVRRFVEDVEGHLNANDLRLAY